jgi:two-component system response regulator FixJ
MPGLVHIVDDDEMFRGAMSFMLAAHNIPSEIYAGGAELLRDCRLERGCILLDLRMPDMDGHEILEALSRRCNILPVIVTSGLGDFPDVVRAIKLGAFDFIQKNACEGDMLAVIGRALKFFEGGEDRRVKRSLALTRLETLTPREREILQGLLAGLSNKAMARRLDLSPRTIEMHRAHMMDALGVSSLSEALLLAVDGELAPLGGDEMEGAPRYGYQPGEEGGRATRSA